MAVQCKTSLLGGNSRAFYHLAFNWDLLDEKSKSPLFPGAWEPWLQMTSAF